MLTFADLAVDYKKLWDQAKIRPELVGAVVNSAKKLRDLKPAYKEVSAFATVPWYVIGLIDGGDAAFNMNVYLHNGDPLTARTVQVPAGRPRNTIRRSRGSRARLTRSLSRACEMLARTRGLSNVSHTNSSGTMGSAIATTTPR
jgi:lysozyme family protein